MANIKTLTDDDRLDLQLDKYDVYEVMPGHYDQLYPKLAEFLIKYSDQLDSDGNPAEMVNELMTNRDVVSVRQEFLGLLSNELLLGKPYFEQFNDKRTALQFSNLLYRSKGTKYSIQQFFRIFYSLDVDVFYGRDFVFNVGQPSKETLEYETQGENTGSTFRFSFPNGEIDVLVKDSDDYYQVRPDIDFTFNFADDRVEFVQRELDENDIPTDGFGYVNDTEIFKHLAATGYIGWTEDSAEKRVKIVTDLDDYSVIGAGSIRRITNAQFFQLFAIMIQTPVSINVWRDAYKDFIHPAGMYLQGRVQIVSSASMTLTGHTILEEKLPSQNEVLTGHISSGDKGDGLFTTDITELWEGPNGYWQRSRINDMDRTEYPSTPSDRLLVGSRDSEDAIGWGRQYFQMHRADVIESRTFDDSDMTLSNTINTLDENIYLVYDSDGRGHPWLPGVIDGRTVYNALATEEGKWIITEDGKILYWTTIAGDD